MTPVSGGSSAEATALGADHQSCRQAASIAAYVSRATHFADLTVQEALPDDAPRRTAFAGTAANKAKEGGEGRQFLRCDVLVESCKKSTALLKVTESEAKVFDEGDRVS